MLEPGKQYRDNSGFAVTIMGRIREYSAEKPYLWSLQGNWYDEQTGCFVSYSLRRGGHYLLPSDNFRSIARHEGKPHNF